MTDLVERRKQGLELFAARERHRDLKLTPKRAAALAKLGVSTVQDLLQHYPRRHVDRTRLRSISELKDLAEQGEDGEVTVHATVQKMGRPFALGAKGRRPGRGGRTMLKATIGDETGTLDVTWFNQDWVARALQPKTIAFFYGRISLYRGRMQMTAPRFEVVRSGKEPFNVGRIIPIYPANADISSDQIRRVVWETLEAIGPIADPVGTQIRTELGLMGREEALKAIHFPDEVADVVGARNRLVFDEVFTLQLGLVYRKRELERTVQGIAHASPKSGSLAESFASSLPFELTDAQRHASKELAHDMAQAHPMHRLLEGEVGSGKTVVAVYACMIAIDGQHQAAFMAPTEVLAEQHFITVSDLLDRAFGESEARNLFAHSSRRPVVRLLTGSTPAAARRAILAGVADGEVDLLIGTHALISETVEFRSLGLAVVDEQHRFGVHQRKQLRKKGSSGEPDVLVMTATPIPRTLAVTIYGDLDLSILDELPRGRRAIRTSVSQGDEGRAAAYKLIAEEVSQGRQAFVVYALREESTKTELRNAKAESKRLARDVWPDFNVGLVHGDMSSDEKEAAMGALRSGATQILVATTVVEVGVDIPNATVMLIEDADRFGLAQLHQLRGRVGRGEHDSYCILNTNLDLSALDDPAVALADERLRAVESTTDGFKLALTDLRQRGEGELFGARQSGMPTLKLVRVLEHADLLMASRELAGRVLDADPGLESYENEGLHREMRDRFPAQALDVIHSG